MSIPIEKIVKVNKIWQAAALGYANIGVGCFFAKSSDVAAGSTLVAGDMVTLDYAGFQSNFNVYTDPVRYAARWFGNSPSVSDSKVYIWDDQSDDIVTALNKAVEKGWFFYPQFPVSVMDDDASVLAINTWVGASGKVAGISSTDPDIPIGATDNIAKVLKSAGNDGMAQVSYVRASDVANDASLRYVQAGLFARFAAVNYSGINTCITGDNVKLPVAGSDLEPQEIAVLKDYAIYYDRIVSGDQTTAYVKSTNVKMTSGKWMDRVIHSAALAIRIQTDLLNRIQRDERAPALDVIGYAALIQAAKNACYPFRSQGGNGFLAYKGLYTDPRDGIQKTAEFGYAILNEPTDINKLTDAQRTAREAYPLTIIAITADGVQSIVVDLTIARSEQQNVA